MITMDTYHFKNKKIHIYVPDSPAPKKGFLVLYILDGNAFTQLFMECVKLMSRNPRGTNVHPMILVGIGTADGDLFGRNTRFYDFTPKRKSDEIDKKRPKLPDGGGIDDFKGFLVELQKEIVDKYEVNQENQSIFSHSLGGLCV